MMNRMLAFVDAAGDGPILQVDGEDFANEVRHGGWNLGDHISTKAPDGLAGLLILEGWVEVGVGPDPDVELVGEWRRLTHWELCRVRNGLTPWEDA